MIRGRVNRQRVNARRRALLSGACAALSLGMLPEASRATPVRRLVHVVEFGRRPDSTSKLHDFEAILKEGGHAGVVVEYFYAERDREKMRRLAEAVVQKAPAVVYSIGTSASIPVFQAIRRNSSVRILQVFHSSDPIEVGLVASHSRPGGFATGIAAAGLSLLPRRLDLMREVIDPVGRGRKSIGVLVDPTHPAIDSLNKVLERTRQALGADLVLRECRDIAGYLEQVRALKVDGFYLTGVPSGSDDRRLLSDQLRKVRKPFVYSSGDPRRDGSLLSYTVDRTDQLNQGARYVSRILDGRDPAAMPVQLPTKYVLTVNERDARSMGVKIPYALRLLADDIVL